MIYFFFTWKLSPIISHISHPSEGETFSKWTLYSRQTLNLKVCLIFWWLVFLVLSFELLVLLLKCWEQVLTSSPMLVILLRLIISEFQRLPFLKPLKKIPILCFPGAWICCPLLQAHGCWVLFLNLPLFHCVTFGLLVFYFSIHTLEIRITRGIRRLHKTQLGGNVLTALLTYRSVDYCKHLVVLYIIV